MNSEAIINQNIKKIESVMLKNTQMTQKLENNLTLMGKSTPIHPKLEQLIKDISEDTIRNKQIVLTMKESMKESKKEFI